MTDQPWIDVMPEQEVAFVAISVARNQIQAVMMPGLSEIRTALRQQGVAAAGPWLTHHHFLKPGVGLLEPFIEGDLKSWASRGAL